jgi:hypothetical protein
MSSTLRLCRYTLFLVAIFVFAGKWGHLLASPEGNCSDVCSGSSNCGTACLIDYDTGSTCGDYGACWGYSCGSTCGSSTDCSTPCVSGSSDLSCSSYNGGQANGECYGTCGDDMCQPPELVVGNCCTEDCGSCTNECDACTPGTDDCGDGYACTANHCCTTIDPGCWATDCLHDSDCCNVGDICQLDPTGSFGECAGPPVDLGAMSTAARRPTATHQ